MDIVKLIKVERDHANEGQPQHDAIKDFPAGIVPYRTVIQGYFEKVQDNCQVCNLVREKPNCSQPLAHSVCVGGRRGSWLYLWFCIHEN